MSNFIQNISIAGLHGRSDIELTLRPRLNIIHGRNGTGKTTLLHILANLIDGDIERFCHLTFERIAVQTNTGAEVVLCQSSESNRGVVVTRVMIDKEIAGQVARDETTAPSLRMMLRQRLGGRPIYLPAFRSVLEATTTRPISASSQQDKELKKILTHESSGTDRPTSQANEAIAVKTLQCRDWFGLFVPIIRFPSLQEVSEQLEREVYAAQLAVAANDQEALSTVFVEVLKAIVSDTSSAGGENIDELLARVQRHLADLRPVEGPDIYSLISALLAQYSDRLRQDHVDMRPILGVYAMALENRAKAQESAFRQIRVFERSVNNFFEQKQLKIDIGVTEPDLRRAVWYRHRRRTVIMLGDRRASLSVLSSGERQILTLLFSATHMSSGDGMVLIDEPELSLNVDWQRIILSEVMLQAGERQIIVCTHAPEIAADHRDCLFELSLKPHAQTQLPLSSETDTTEEE